MINGITAQRRVDNLLTEGCYGVQVPDDDPEVAALLAGPGQCFSGKYRDDLGGQVLTFSLVEEARAAELLYFHSKGVWLKVPKSSARAQTGRPPVTVRWVDVNKGDGQNPNADPALWRGNPRRTTRATRRTSRQLRPLKRCGRYSA